MARFSSKETLNFSDINGLSADLNEYSRPKGWFIGRTVGIVIVVLTVAVMVLIGLVVHFAVPRQPTECICNCPTNLPYVTPNAEEQWQHCKQLSAERQECLCETTTQRYTTPDPSMTTAPSTPAPRATDLRLNKTIIPYHYDVELTPYIYDREGTAAEKAKFNSFDGKVTIYMNITGPIDVITLHGYKITIDHDTLKLTKLDDSTNVNLDAMTPLEEDKDRQFFRIKPASSIEAGRYSLSMSHNGTLVHTDWQGLYISSYKENGITRYLATTQFETSDARRAFPCFDEPFFKATFNITLVRRHNYTSISNMPIIQTENRDTEWEADIYEKSVIMPTYLLAFVVSDFRQRNYTSGNITYRFWSRPAYTQYLGYAINVTEKLVHFFENYTGIPFPISKIDQIAIPDFSAGAMENWGLITYRETALLYHPDYSRIYDKEYVFTVISHELTHQWFGNLVTCDWWDDLWLNEGFATYFEYSAVEAVEPVTKMNLELVRAIERVMIQDSRGTSQPMYLKGLEHHDDHGSAFSSISYNKAGGVIRMMGYFLGKETFKKGLQRYLTRHAYKTAKHEDLYRALEEQAIEDKTVAWDSSKANLSTIMGTWVDQIGYPVINIKKSDGNTYTITQHQFLYNSSDTMNTKYPNPFGQYLWSIPFTYWNKSHIHIRIRSDPQHEWIYRADTVDFTEGDEWLLGNIFRRGYFRVNYDDNIWNNLIQKLSENYTLIPQENRGELIDDAFNLARAGLNNITLPLRLMNYLKNETAYLPWYAALRRRLIYMDAMLRDSETYPKFQTFMRELVTPAYDRLGWNDSDDSQYEEKRLRDIIIREACKRDHMPCVTQAIQLYWDWMNNTNNNPISSNQRAQVYCTAIAHGGYAEWEFAYNKHEEYRNNQENEFYVYEFSWLKQGMACSRQTWILKRYINVAAKTWKSTTAVNYIAQTSIGKQLVWDFLRENWNVWTFSMSRSSILSTVTETFSTQYEYNKMMQFTEDFPTSSYKNTFQSILKTIQDNINWRTKNEMLINEFFNVTSSQTMQAPAALSMQATDTDAQIQNGEKDFGGIPGKMDVDLLMKLDTK